MYKKNFYVNEKKGVVVCKITDIRCDMHDEIQKKGLGFPSRIVCEMINDLLPNTYTGKARCSGNDKFDEKIGSTIAYRRAVRKVNNAKKRFMQKFIRMYTNDYNETIAGLNALAQRYEKAETGAVEKLNFTLKLIDEQ